MSVLIEDGDGNWGVSFTGSNPEAGDYVGCASKEDAIRLNENLSALIEENERLLAANRDVKAWSDAAEHDLATAEADNARLREVLHQFVFEFTKLECGEISRKLIIEDGEKVLARPLSTSALDAHVAKVTAELQAKMKIRCSALRQMMPLPTAPDNKKG